MLALDPDVVIDDGDAILPAARAALRSREKDIAMRLVLGFDKRFSNHKDTPAVYFVAAKLASEHFRQHGMAQAWFGGEPSASMCEDRDQGTPLRRWRIFGTREGAAHDAAVPPCGHPR